MTKEVVIGWMEKRTADLISHIADNYPNAYAVGGNFTWVKENQSALAGECAALEDKANALCIDYLKVIWEEGKNPGDHVQVEKAETLFAEFKKAFTEYGKCLIKMYKAQEGYLVQKNKQTEMALDA